MIEITNVTKTYGKNPAPAVDGLSLTLNKGEIFGFLGPNGAGKTTTIKMLMGVLPFSDGSITIDGLDVKKDALAAKKIMGYVPDDNVIYDTLTGNEYINFMADIFGVSVAERKERAEKLLEKFSLKDAAGKQIKSYSHGMKQKIAIIGALVHNPKLWVLDEPMTGLDPQSVFELKNLMREHCDAGNAVFFSTHILDVAERLCDRIGIINKGKLVFTGTLEESKTLNKDMSLEQFFISLTNKTENAE